MKPRMLPKIRCTAAQKMALIDYMWDHRRLARYEYDAQTAEVEWQRLAETLNQTGSVKTVDKWKVTWRDLKRKALRDVLQASQDNNKHASEAALKIQEIMYSRDDDPTGETMNFSMSSSPTHSVFVHDESYQSQDFIEPDQEGQEMEYSVSSQDRRSQNGMELESIECTPDFSSDSSPTSPIPRPLTKSRSNQEQINTLVDCMAINTGMAFGNQTIPNKMADWRRLRQLLNRIGPAKRTVAWQQSWRDLKRNALERNNTSTKNNSPLTRKIVEIVKAYNESGHKSNDATPDGNRQLRLPPQIQHLVKSHIVHKTQSHDAAHSPAVSLGQHNYNKMSPVQREVTESAVNLVPSTQSRQRYKPKTRSTNSQILALVDYMDRHPALAIARSVAGDTQCPYVAEWRRLRHYLNKVGTAKRSTMAWKRTWRDLKKTARKEPNNERNSHLNQKILDIVSRASETQPDTQSNKETGDTQVPSTADFDQMSISQMSSGQRSSCSSLVQSDTGKPRQVTSSKIIRKTRCTNAQKHALVDYMVSHLALATSKFIESLEVDPYYAEWRQLSKYLNKIGGTAKSTLSWKRTWRDLKISVVKKKTLSEPLSGLDRKILQIRENDPNDLQTVQEFESVLDPTDGMTTLYLRPPELTLETDVLLCDQDVSHGDPANQDSQHSTDSKQSGQESTEGHSRDVSPRPSSEMSPDQRSLGTESPVQRLEQHTPVLSENENTQDRADNTIRSRCSRVQVNALVNYMYRHPQLAKACLYTDNEQDPRCDEWRLLARQLNQIDRTVPAKSITRWKRTWRSLVITARRKDRKKSKWKDNVSRKVLQIMNENVPSESKLGDIATFSSEDYICLQSNDTSLPDPLESEQGEVETDRRDGHVRVPKRRTNVRRSSNLQLRALADYMLAHPELALNQCNLNARTPAWVRITRHLNSIGPARSSEAWRQTWKDLKLRVIARARKNETNSSLLGFRERKILKLIGMPSSSPLPETDSETVEEYDALPEPEVAFPPRAPSPRSVLYNLAEILARKSPNDRPESERDRNNKPPIAETNNISSETNDILRGLVQELKRSNELKAEQNGYLKELLTEFRNSSYTHARHTEIATNIVDSQTDGNETEVLKKEDDVTDSGDVSQDTCADGGVGDEMQAQRTPVIRPVALASLTTSNTPEQPEYRSVRIQSIVRAETKHLPRRLVRLKDGTMILMPATARTQAKTNQDTKTDQLYVMCTNKRK